MEFKAFLPLCFILVFSLGQLHAQSVSSTSAINISEIEALTTNNSDSEWAFWEDVESQKIYIDFAELGGNFAELVLQDVNGNQVIKEDLLDLPVDSIYELDLSILNKGEYTLELRTYKEPIFKTISVE
ncbi:MAG: hypothetical protein AAF502_01425 [Bacteroidota bacterium]